ncbi:MAG: hypothetical protein JW700_01090 [Candidatus Aenigmarchaeota archaeon]|nr:hypothetical protein [Candidatus Aenigmarchaeota archaeon]
MPAFADSSDTVTVDVNVSEASSITVLPATLNWTDIASGQAGGTKYLNIKNTGSLNVSEIYAYVDTLITEPVRPYGLAYPTNYSAGSVITLKNETDTGYYFAGRIEWNWTQDIPNNDWSAVTDPVAWGYFRNASSDYVWVLGNGTTGCNDTDAEFAVEYDVDLGTTATRTPESIGAADDGDDEWSYFSVSDASSPLDTYCVAAYYDCTKVYIYHYDQRTSPNFAGCGLSSYLQEANLTPGYSIILEVDAWVPSGYPSGYLNTTTLTVYASS